MSGEGDGVLTVPILIFTSVIVSFTYFIVKFLNTKSTPQNVKKDKPKMKEPKQQHKAEKQPRTKEPANKNMPKTSHPHLITTLKGHKNNLTGGDFSPSGKYFLTASKDRTVMIWTAKDLSSKEKMINSTNTLDFDHAQHVCWSPDSKAIVIHKAIDNHIQVYKVNKKNNGTLGDLKKSVSFPEIDRNATFLTLGFSATGKFLTTMDEKNHVYILDLKGSVMEKFDTRHGETYSATLSPCGRFLVTTGFTPDAKVYEVRFKKSGSYETSKRVFELKGHKSGIYNCSINCDSSKMVTVSKDGTWKLYNTNVDYEKEQEPYLILTGKYEKDAYDPFVTLSPDGRTVAISNGPNLTLYSALNGSEMYTIKNIYADAITHVKFDPSSKYVLTLGEKTVHIYHNVAGYHTTIQDLTQSKTKATTAGMRERIDTQIKEAQDSLTAIKKSLKI